MGSESPVGKNREAAGIHPQRSVTNLHLLNARGDTEVVRARMGTAWDAALATCERAMLLFPDSLYAGLDLLVATDYRRHALLEINAFGDLLPNVFHAGLDTYAAELQAVQLGGQDHATPADRQRPPVVALHNVPDRQYTAACVRL